MSWVPGGTFLMGSDDFYPEERPAHRAQVDGIERLGMRRNEPELLDAHAGIDAVDAELQQAQEVRDLPRGPRGADRHHLLAAVYAQAGHSERSSAKPPLLQYLRQIAQQIAHHLLDRLGGADRLEQPALDERHLRIFARSDGLGHRAQRLIEAEQQRLLEEAEKAKAEAPKRQQPVGKKRAKKKGSGS